MYAYFKTKVFKRVGLIAQSSIVNIPYMCVPFVWKWMTLFVCTIWIILIAAHPKIKAFVTHGGIYGIQEALCHPVPLIVFPVFSEQDYNAIKIGSRGYGIPMDYTTITEQSFTQAVHEIIHNKT